VSFYALDIGLDSGSSYGKFLTVILSAVADAEGDNIRSRTKFALAKARRDGKVYGRIAFGYRAVNSRLVPDPASAKGLARAQKMRSDGKTLKQIGG